MARLIVALACIALTACSLPGVGRGGGCTMVIDWADFVQVGDTQFVAGLDREATSVQETDLGPVVMTVKFKVEGNVCDPHYRTKDGDAAFLEVGTPVYQVKGHSPTELVAARRNGVLLAYWDFKPPQ